MDTVKDEKDSISEDCNECMPLDLSVNAGRLSPGLRDSGTESDDSGGRCTPEGGDCKAYKKSLMKRYCKCGSLFLESDATLLGPTFLLARFLIAHFLHQ